MAHTRLALLATDLEEARERFFLFLVLAVACMTALALSIVLGVGFLVLLADPEYRLTVIGLFAGQFFALGLGALYALRRQWQRSPRLFDGCLEALGRDRAAMGGDS
jgi:uncharacterized membrane protein YqjE